MTSLFIIAAVAVVAIIVILLFNHLIAKRQMTNNGWADIDVQLKRRADLIPQLVTTVQAYAAHEKNLFEEVAQKRNAALAAGDNAAQRGEAESALSKPVGRLIALGEAYPDLKANQNFLDLQNELSDTEDKIEMARRFYNGAVRELNTAAESFPSNIVASLFGVKQRAFFEITAAGDRAVPNLGLTP